MTTPLMVNTVPITVGTTHAASPTTPSPLSNGKGQVAYLDQGVGKVRDLTAASAPTGSAKTVTIAPK